MNFDGFPIRALYTPVPDLLLGPLLERITDLAELKVTLRAIWLLRRRPERPPQLPVADLLADGALRRGLPAEAGADAEAAIRRGLTQAAARRVFLLWPAGATDPARQVCLLNDEASRRWLRRQTPESPLPAPDEARPLAALPEQPGSNIFTLYEDNIGLLTPLLAEELKEAESQYPWPWVAEAFRMAVEANHRNWRYIEAILRRYAEAGGPTELPGSGRGNGKPGRHSEADNRQKYLEEYQRRRRGVPGQRDGSG